ncbi:MAG TPA: FAD-binding oxidoreductase [Edaphocola sp.]|nr:FAD-binding oxidoreductase [Edaphocola sp.]
MKLKSNEPFWLVKNGIKHSYPSLRADISTDLLIVGAGITGSLIAHRCIAMGYKTVLIDRREVANGSTSATTSMLQYEIDIPLYQLMELIGEKGAIDSYKACFDSINQVETLVHKIKSNCGFKKKDSVYFAAFKKDVPWLQQELEARQKAGFRVAWLNADEILQRYGLHNTFGGIHSAQGASIDAFALAHDLLAYNHSRGLDIYDKTNIAEVKHTRRGGIVTTDRGYTIRARNIIYCNGFESTEMIKERFVNLHSTYAVVGESGDYNFSRIENTLFWNTAQPYIYMRTTDDNRLLIGGEDEEFVNAKRRDALLGRKTQRLEAKLRKLLPDYDFRTDFAWAGTFGTTKDGLPYIGTHPDFPKAYFVLGFGGNGITFSVIGMDMLEAFLEGRKHPLSPYFRFGR